MNDQHRHLEMDANLEETLPECPKPGRLSVSPLGWGIKGRVLCAAMASAFLWLAVGWAIGWLA